MNFLKYRLPLYAAIALILYLLVQLFYLHVAEIGSSGVQSLYRKKPTTRRLEPRSPPKGSQPMAKPVKGFLSQPRAPESPSNPFTVGSWDIEDSLCAGVKVTVVTDKDGNPKLDYTPMSFGFMEIGRIRELGIYVEKGIELQGEVKNSLEVGVEWRQDLGRVGPVWSTLYGRAGWERVEVDGARMEGGKVVVGLKGSVRF